MEPKIFVAERSGAGLQRESARLGSEKRCRPASAWSPPSWKKFDAKHREAPTISLDPPGTRRMLLKMEKDVNACLRGGILAAGRGVAGATCMTVRLQEIL